MAKPRPSWLAMVVPATCAAASTSRLAMPMKSPMAISPASIAPSASGRVASPLG